MADLNNRRADEDYSVPILTKAIKAGRRTYFIDVRATKDNENYLTLTESRKKFHTDGSVTFERHKIHLYKEDFEKVSDGLIEVINFIRQTQPEFVETKIEESLEI